MRVSDVPDLLTERSPDLEQAHKGRDVAVPLPELRRQQRREDLHPHGRQRALPQFDHLGEDLEDVRMEVLHILLRTQR